MPRNDVSTPPEGFCIGVMAFLSSVEEVPSFVRELQESLRSSWAPGANLRLLVLLPSPVTTEHLSNPSLSSIYLASVLYLVGRDDRVSLHRVHPFTGVVLQIIPADTDLFPSPLQVEQFNLEKGKTSKHLTLIEFRMQWVGLSLQSPSPSLLSRRTQRRRMGTSDLKTVLTFASLTLLLNSTTLQ